jgi:hypothetical protein
MLTEVMDVKKKNGSVTIFLIKAQFLLFKRKRLLSLFLKVLAVNI